MRGKLSVILKSQFEKAVLSDLGNLSYNGITGNGFEIFLNS